MNLHDFIILMNLLIGCIKISIGVEWNTIRNIQVNTFWSYKHINTYDVHNTYNESFNIKVVGLKTKYNFSINSFAFQGAIYKTQLLG